MNLNRVITLDNDLELVISSMTGKLEGMVSINTNPLTNSFCQEMHQNQRAICSVCYSINMLKTIRKNCINAYERNSKTLSTQEYSKSEVPTINASYIRINAHGELINMNHLKNIIKLAQRNPWANVSLFTKRLELIEECDYDIPDNMILVYSHPDINPKDNVIPNKMHKLFRVFTEDYISKNSEININCKGQKCFKCRTCYHRYGKTHINELVKSIYKNKVNNIVNKEN